MAKTEADDATILLPEDFIINPLDLNTEFCEFPAKIAYWNARYADCVQAAMVAKAEWEREKARLTLSIHSNAEYEKKRITVAQVEAQVMQDEDVQDAHMIYIEREAERLRCRGTVDALITKRDMLQSLGAKLRIEMQADPAVLDGVSGNTAQWLEKQG